MPIEIIYKNSVGEVENRPLSNKKNILKELQIMYNFYLKKVLKYNLIIIDSLSFERISTTSGNSSKYSYAKNSVHIVKWTNK